MTETWKEHLLAASKAIFALILFVLLVTTTYAQSSSSVALIDPLLQCPCPSPTPPVFGAVPEPAILGDVIPDPTVMSYGNATAAFGRIHADHYLSIPVTVLNGSQAQAQISGLTLYLDPTQCNQAAKVMPGFPVADCLSIADRYFRFSVAALAPAPQGEVLGSAATRMSERPREKILRLVDFSLTIGTTILPFNFVGRDFRNYFPIATGVGIPALRALFPDAGPGQLQRLHEMSYSGRTVLGPGESTTFYVFIAADYLFAKDDWKMFKAGTNGSREALELRQILQLILTGQVRWSPVVAQPQRFTTNRIARP